MDAMLAAPDAWGIPRGAPVYDAAGEKLGRLVAADAYELVLARGVLFPSRHTVDLAAVDRYEDGKLVLALTKAQALGDG